MAQKAIKPDASLGQRLKHVRATEPRWMTYARDIFLLIVIAGELAALFGWHNDTGLENGIHLAAVLVFTYILQSDVRYTHGLARSTPSRPKAKPATKAAKLSLGSK